MREAPLNAGASGCASSSFAAASTDPYVMDVQEAQKCLDHMWNQNSIQSVNWLEESAVPEASIRRTKENPLINAAVTK